MSEYAFLDIKWRRDNLEIDNKPRGFLISWKDKIQSLPDYLTETTLKEIEKTKAKVEDILTKQNIQVVVEYFEKLTLDEKKKCMEELKAKLEELAQKDGRSFNNLVIKILSDYVEDTHK